MPQHSLKPIIFAAAARFAAAAYRPAVRRGVTLGASKSEGIPMSITNALASLAVSRLSSSVPWYAKLFGRSADATPMPTVAEWKFERGGWLQVYELQERAGRGSVTLAVSSVDDQIVNLRKLGIDAGQPIVNGKMKVVMIKDPDGNSIAFAEAADAGVAH
jgi:predicted enzyme related to lactoylglutathione lyase